LTERNVVRDIDLIFVTKSRGAKFVYITILIVNIPFLHLCDPFVIGMQSDRCEVWSS